MEKKIRLLFVVFVVIGGIILGYSACKIASFWQSQIETRINYLSQPDYPAVQVR